MLHRFANPTRFLRLANAVLPWLTGITALLIATATTLGFKVELSILIGLVVFGVVFAVNSSIHSFLVVHYAKEDKVAQSVGFYYMSNACGRLLVRVRVGVRVRVRVSGWPPCPCRPRASGHARR